MSECHPGFEMTHHGRVRHVGPEGVLLVAVI